MTWTPRANWINVKTAASQIPGGINAVGDGVTDDTAAIQSCLSYLSANPYSRVTRTIYFPAGTYKISSTLQITNVSGYSLIGCGLNTVIKWYGPAGGAMFWANTGNNCRYIGFVWDGGGTGGLHGTGGASCAYEEYSDINGVASYTTGIRHENESFRNFTVTGTYLTDKYYPNGFPAAAIISGFASLPMPVGEVTIFNCRFYNCTTGLYNAVDIYNNFMWVIDGCEFDNNGTGFNGGLGACYVLVNSHFLQNSTDIMGGHGVRGQRLTSSGSGQFFSGPTSGDAFQDCWIDGWTDTAGTLMFNRGGQASVVDCTFTTPPAGALGPIWLYEDVAGGQDILLSNNYAPSFPSGSGILHQQVATNIDWVPAGSMGANITSATQTFLQSTYPADSANIIDVTKAPYTADPNFTHDSTATIQAAITAAQMANNGSIVYIPVGIYKISSTLIASGGNYSIQGEGFDTQLCWYSTSNGTILSVSNPQNISVKRLSLVALDNLSTRHGYNATWPVCDMTTITGLAETATGASSSVYDDVFYGAMIPLAGGSNEGDPNGPGIVLSGLPAGSTVYMPLVGAPLTVTDCGQAQIFSMMAYMGSVNVSGATNPKTGFLGLMVAEGGQQTAGNYNFTINDNQNLLVGPYYSEQCANDVDLLGGAGTEPGQVMIQTLNSSPTPASVTINIDNYEGRLFYGGGAVSGGSGTPPPIQITQAGSNPINLMLAENFYAGTAAPLPTLGAGANLISTLNEYGIPGTSSYNMTDTPNPLTGADYAALAQSLDDSRQLGALNLAVEYGIVNPSGLVAYWKLDEAAGPSADSSMSGITGTWQNDPTFSMDTPSAIPYADSGCLTFNGTDQYIDMGNPAALPTGTAARTICGWAKADSTAAGWGWIAAFGSPSESHAMFIGRNGTTLYGGGYEDDLTVPNFWDNNWHFIALTYDGTTAKLYADGVLKASATKTWDLIPSECYIGEQVNDEDQYWNGSIDDVRIYNQALTATEISHLATGSP